MDRRPPKESSTRLCAALDLGSNMFRLVIGRPGGDGVEIVEKAVEVVSIGRDVDRGLRITDAARARAAECLDRFRRRAESLGVTKTRSVATAAFRKAENGAAVAEALAPAIGCSIEVIAADREAALAFRGATSESANHGAVSILDIGGASTEYVARSEGVDFSISLDLGVISLHERIPGSADDPRRARQLEAHAREVLAPLATAPRTGPFACHALGGAAVALAAFRARRTYEQLLGASSAPFTRRELSRLHDDFVAMPLSERARTIGVSEAHAELVFAGYWILDVAMEYVGAEAIVPTGRGVAEGLLGEMLAHAD